MLSPTPFSLCCAILLCLPLAVVFTVTVTTTNTTTIGVANGNITLITSDNRSSKQVRICIPCNTKFKKTQRKFKNKAVSSAPPLPPPPQPSLPEDDEPLFRLAARVNSYPKPTRKPKKIAFMFLTTSPLPFAPLWELFFDQNQTHHGFNKTKLFNVYIHADPSFNYDPPFSGVFSGRVIPSKPTQRFSPSLISAARRLIAHALLHDRSNAMFALLSSTCIPLHSFDFTYDTLVASQKSFIEILNDEPGSYDRYAARGPDVMLPEVPFQNFRVGSQFFVLTRRHARLVVGDERVWSKFKLPCVRWDTCYPEENYFPTLLSMRDPRGCVPATLTHVDWTGRFDGHPRTYEANEVGPELILSVRKVTPRYGDDGSTKNASDATVAGRHDPFLFARKFSPESLPTLMGIARDVIFRD